ncbi:MAG: hypothetical protein MK078_01700 [Crocinitomicaceae bacterium]|nr:hypothetical protein [Crocinitomicaceae bacterium]
MYTKEKDSYSVQMFDAINKRRVQHDNELKNLFKGKMSDNQIAVAKNQLYKQLLTIMIDYEHDEKMKIASSIAQIEFLIRKGLIMQARQLLESVKNGIKNTELFSTEIQLIEIQRKLDSININSVDWNRIDSSYERQKEIIDQQGLISYYSHLNYKKEVLRQKGHQNGMKLYLEEFKKIHSDSLIHSNSSNHSFLSKYYMLLTNKHCAAHTGDYPNFYKYGRALVNHLNNHPKERNKRPESILWAYYSYIYSYIILKKAPNEIDNIFNEFDEFLNNKLKKDKAFWSLGKSMYYLFVLKRSVILQDIKLESRTLTELQEFTDQHGTIIPKRFKMLLSYHIAYHFFLGQEYKKALPHIQTLFSHYNQQTGEGMDLFILGKLLRSLVLKERGDELGLQNSLKSVYRFLQKEESKFIFHQKVLELLKLIIKTRAEYTSILNYLDELNQDEGLNPYLELLDFKKIVASHDKGIKELR